MTASRLSALWVTVLGAACVAAPPLDRRVSEQDVLEAVLRFQFQKNASVQQQAAKVYCILVDKSDPDARFLQRFINTTPPVRNASDCSAHPREGVRENATGNQGLIFWVGRVKWLSNGEADVKGGYYEYGLSAAENTFVVRWDGQAWVVVRATLDSIS